METRYIYFAGGCFWGMEALMQSIPGVTDALSGYANGTGEADANYETVCAGKTGFRETVRVAYDPEKVSLDRCCLRISPLWTRPRATVRARYRHAVPGRRLLCRRGVRQGGRTRSERRAAAHEPLRR